MQVIGICRFSYPAIGGFQVEHDTIEARIAHLYDPDRLNARFASFETITLPGLRAQTDSDFTYLIVIGDSLPSAYLNRLNALVADMPQVVIQSHPPGRHRPVMNAAINSLRVQDGQPSLQFRLDDDDGVSIHFVERLRKTAAALRPMLKMHRHVAIDFNQGYAVAPSATGISAAPIIANCWTPALAVMSRAKLPQTIMSFAHAKLARNMPTISIPGENMMLRGFNDHNDSRQKPQVRALAMAPLDAEGVALFKDTFNIDLDAVRRAFSAAQ